MLVASDKPKNVIMISNLEVCLKEFYRNNSDYYETAKESDKHSFIESLFPYIDDIVRRRGRAKILEVGAGITQLPDTLRERFASDVLDITLHDINDTNMAFYEGLDVSSVLIGDLTQLSISEKYDLIVSFFVYEHIVRPRPFVDTMLSLLADGGRICIICPRYDVPGYIPPALRHRSVPSRIANNLRIFLSVLMVRLGGRPAFLVETDPAVLHRPWRCDYDAIHMVSRADLVAHLGKRFSVDDVTVASAATLKGRLVSHLQLKVVITRKAEPTCKTSRSQS